LSKGVQEWQAFDQILLLACGTSYYSACVAKYWFEEIARIPTQVEIASEYRYRQSIPRPKTLVIVVSQSGETADTLAALRHAKQLGHTMTLSICNVASSAMVRETRWHFLTHAGTEVGVASTKAFTTQLLALYLLACSIAKRNGLLSNDAEKKALDNLRHLPQAIHAVLALEPQIISWSQLFTKCENALFLGRGVHFPIALEGALKLKEISYIHAEAYPAGELKHGPLALVTDKMPVVTVAPNDTLLEKLKSNMQEVKARGGQLFVFADQGTQIKTEEGIRVIRLPEHYGDLSPILHVIPLQLLAYHTACALGTDVDKPRNLAKSVTVISNQLATAPSVGGTAQSIEPAGDIPAEWWALYRSPELDALIKQALKRNPNLAAADATLRAAQENANAAFGSLLFPSFGLGGSATRQQINPSSFGQGVGSPSIYNVYNTSVSVNYNLDVFGGARRAVQSTQAQAEISGFQLEGAYLNLTANIVTTAIREAALRAQYAANLEIYEAQKNLADIIAKQLEIGTASRVDLTSQISLAASSQIDLLNLDKNLSFTRNQLSVFVGEFPGNALLAKFDLSTLNLPEKIPLSIPSELVRQRPDIRAAESYIKSTNALVGVATANLL